MAAPLGQVDYGTDVSTYPDLDPAFAAISGTRVIGESVARRLMTARGTLPDAPNYGTDVRVYLCEGFNLSGSTLTQMKNAIERECLQDERVATADAGMYFNPQTGVLNVTLVVGPAQGPTFQLVISVTALTVTLLSSG